MEIRKLVEADWDAVRAIYVQGIETGHATFETQAPSWETWDGGHLGAPRLVAVQDQTLIGWAALSPVSSRNVYRGVAEVSVYVAGNSQGAGVGLSLLKQLIVESEAAGIWTLQASIFPENTASIALHQACGFRSVGYRERIGKMNGIWRDTLLFEKRSNNVN